VYPLRTDVVWTQGEEKLSEYVFGNKNKPHRFCPECGTSILIDFGNTEGKGKEFLAVSVSDQLFWLGGEGVCCNANLWVGEDF